LLKRASLGRALQFLQQLEPASACQLRPRGSGSTLGSISSLGVHFVPGGKIKNCPHVCRHPVSQRQLASGPLPVVLGQLDKAPRPSQKRNLRFVPSAVDFFVKLIFVEQSSTKECYYQPPSPTFGNAGLCAFIQFSPTCANAHPPAQ
jgi:hypothetical protein